MADAARCEVCDKHTDRPQDRWRTMQMGYSVGPLPDGWLRLVVLQPEFTAEVATPPEFTAEVCSWLCAARWTAQQAASRGEPMPEQG